MSGGKAETLLSVVHSWSNLPQKTPKNKQKWQKQDFQEILVFN